MRVDGRLRTENPVILLPAITTMPKCLPSKEVADRKSEQPQKLQNIKPMTPEMGPLKVVPEYCWSGDECLPID
uniref:Uncharacterized protein n=1 Tax=Amphimedon queenslandica TaxID=400682 RepID=A0A1X7VWX7_AMPQE